MLRSCLTKQLNSQGEETFQNIASEEISYRKLQVTFTDVLQDAFDTALLITRREQSSENFHFLQKGINNIVNFIIDPLGLKMLSFVLIRLLILPKPLTRIISGIQRYSAPEDVAGLTITQAEFTKLNRLKTINPEAFFYWYHAIG